MHRDERRSRCLVKFQGTCYGDQSVPITTIALHSHCLHTCSRLALGARLHSSPVYWAWIHRYSLSFFRPLSPGCLVLGLAKVPSSYITDKSALWDGSWDWRPGSSPSFYNLPSVLGQLLVGHIVLFWVGKEEPADGLHGTSGLAWSKSASGLAWSKSAFSQNCCSFPASPWPSTHKICH